MRVAPVTGSFAVTKSTRSGATLPADCEERSETAEYNNYSTYSYEPAGHTVLTGLVQRKGFDRPLETWNGPGSAVSFPAWSNWPPLRP